MKAKCFWLANTIVLGACAWSAHAQVVNEDLKLLPSDGVANNYFGSSVAIDNGVIAIGAINDGDNGPNSGAVYLFDTATGTQLFKLLPSDGMEYDNFGYSIAIDKGVVAVGAYGDDDNGDTSGSAYLFDATTGAQLAKLLPGDGAALNFFGSSIAIDNGVVAVGARHDDDYGLTSGSAYLFDAATGAQLFKLLPNDAAGNENFGFSIAIDNGVVAVGAPFNPFFRDPGSAYLFDAATGVQLFKLIPSKGQEHDFFGGSIAIDEGVVAVGAPFAPFHIGPGSAYLFDAATGVQLSKLLPSDGVVNGHFFGSSIAMNDGVVAVGAVNDDENGFHSGAAYLFDAASEVQLTKLLPSDGMEFDNFGESIAIDNGAVVVGADQADILSSDPGPGSAYLYSVPAPPCPADLTGDGVLNFFDVSAFLSAFANQDPVGDITGDGIYNFFDVSAFLTDFNSGCP